MAQTDWRGGFKKALIDILIRDGELMKPTEYDRTYGWVDYDKKRVREVKTLLDGGEIDYEASTWEESTWNEFTRVKGIDLRIVMKTKEEFDWRWEGSVGELIVAVVSEAGK